MGGGGWAWVKVGHYCTRDGDDRDVFVYSPASRVRSPSDSPASQASIAMEFHFSKRDIMTMQAHPQGPSFFSVATFLYFYLASLKASIRPAALSPSPVS